MDKEKAIYYIEHSFLSSLLLDEDVTDISYNGDDFYYVSNTHGRKKSDIVVERQVVRDFIRQIANVTEQQFCFTNPILDTMVGKYRINATHQSIGRVDNEEVVTFSIRIASYIPRITDDSKFLPPLLIELFKVLLINHHSLVIGGITGTGKTELQKYILRKMNDNERVIVVDNVMELDVRNDNSEIDLTLWQTDERNIATSPSILIKNALRNNPDWLILAEARDKEMIDVLNSAMTGIPIITTIHAYDVKSLPFRMGRMVLRNSFNLQFKETLSDIYYHFHFYIYLRKKVVKGSIYRYISDIGFVDDNGRFFYIYRNINNNHQYYSLPNYANKYFKDAELSEEFIKTFLKERNNNEQE